MRPEILTQKADELEAYYRKYDPDLAPLVKQCYLNTIDTTVKKTDDNGYFVITGDIDAMWLRDSAFQVMHYVPLAGQDEELKEILRQIIKRQVGQILTDPYANAFNEKADGRGHQDKTEKHPMVWERKYELDSLCAPLYLSYRYWKVTADSTVFDENYHNMLRTVCRVIRTEQDHPNSPYTFERFDCPVTDTLPCEGKGSPVGYTGMSWSGFRPSDDCCTYGYLVPANLMAVNALRYASELAEDRYGDGALASELEKLAGEIAEGVAAYGTFTHPKYGVIYAYETDGLGRYNLMDDANSPSLLALPYLECCDADDEIYRNTRTFILSEDNPFYFRGKAASGIGSPHTPDQYIWHMAVVMQALTSDDREEIATCLAYLAGTHAGTNYMHESFDKDDPSKYTRSWFAWANSMFAALTVRLMEEHFFEAGEEDCRRPA